MTIFQDSRHLNVLPAESKKHKDYSLGLFVPSDSVTSSQLLERLSDVAGIVKLSQANDPEHGGMLLGHLEPEAVMMTISKMSSVVARKDGQVVGFLLSWSKATANLPIIKVMLQAYAGTKDAYLYGPICVDETMRGQGIAAKMFAKLKDFLPDREGILFIKANNKASLQAHQKMGMCKMAEFIYEGTEFLVFAYNG